VGAFLAGSENPLLPHDPLWFSPTCLPYSFDPKADCPKWKTFLHRNLAGDQGKVRLLQQWAGYLLLHDTTLQRFLMMIGDGANGKSVVCAVLTGLLGEDNVSTVPLEFFGERFRLNGTLGKLANIVSEVGELDKMAEGQVKAFVVGDLMEFEQKYKQPFKARPTARLTLAANNAPHFSDKTDGIWRRAILFPFTVQIPVHDQIAGMDKPEWWRDTGEMPGVFLWALAGLYDLRQAKHFTIPDSCRQAAEKLRVESNPPRRFLLEHYHVGEGEVLKKDIYKEYGDWCMEMGHHAMAEIGFGREVYRLFPAVKDGKTQGTLGKRENCYQGLNRKPPGE
jgi:putative DNA primase/helicase